MKLASWTKGLGLYRYGTEHAEQDEDGGRN